MKNVNLKKNMSKTNSKLDWSIAKRLLIYIFKNYRWRSVLVLFGIIVSTLAGVIGSVFIEKLIDDYISPLMLVAQPDFSSLGRAILWLAFIYAVGLIITVVYNLNMVIISQGIIKKIRDDMFFGMQTLPLKYFDTHPFGDVMSSYTNDTDTLDQMISQGLPQIFSSIITIIAVIGAMFYLNLHLTLFVLVTVFFMVLISKKIGGQSVKFFSRQQQVLGNLNGYIEEMIMGQKVIKVFCHEQIANNQFEEKNNQLNDVSYQANRLANILQPVMNNLGILQYVLIAIFGGALAIYGHSDLTLGTIASFLILSNSLTRPVSQVFQQVGFIATALAGAKRIFNLMDQVPEDDDGSISLVNITEQDGKITDSSYYTGFWAWKDSSGSEPVYTKLRGDVRLQEVDFAYDSGKNILHQISVYAEPGQKVAFVGATGAGKTTISNLINRFYDVADGKIIYDGLDVKNIKKSDLRKSIGLVLQDVNLFSGTIMENIRYGRLKASDEEVMAAAKLVDADDFISRLPNGYNTKLTNAGADLSQGQKQLLSIARTAIANPPVMILDEATSSIDTRTEAIVQRGLEKLMAGRTVFIIAHRLSTIRQADVIMVLEHGRIIERGSHEKLLADRGSYYQLYTGVFELE